MFFFKQLPSTPRKKIPLLISYKSSIFYLILNQNQQMFLHNCRYLWQYDKRTTDLEPILIFFVVHLLQLPSLRSSSRSPLHIYPHLHDTCLKHKISYNPKFYIHTLLRSTISGLYINYLLSVLLKLSFSS